MKTKLKLLAVLVLSIWAASAFSQSRDQLLLSDGRQVDGSFELSFNKEEVIDRSDLSIRFKAEEVQEARIGKQTYHPVIVNIQGRKRNLLAQQLYDGEIDLLQVQLNKNSLPVGMTDLTLYFFRQQGQATIIQQDNIRSFYRIYFGDCYEQMDIRNHRYSTASISQVLDAYHECTGDKVVLRPEARPHYRGSDFHVLGSYGKQWHYIRNEAFTPLDVSGPHFSVGAGYSYHFKNGMVFRGRLFFEGSRAEADLVEVITRRDSIFLPTPVFAFDTTEVKFYDHSHCNLTASASIGYNVTKGKKLSITPAAGMRVGSYLRNENQIDIEVPIEFKSFAFGLEGSVQLDYQLTEKISLFQSSMAQIDYRWVNVGPAAENYVIPGLSFYLGVSCALHK